LGIFGCVLAVVATIELLPGARQLTVIEAKMASGLSAGTKHAPNFNQAARNVAALLTC